MNKFKLLAIILIGISVIGGITYLAMNAYNSANTKLESKAIPPSFEFKKEVILSDDGIPLRNDITRDEMIKIINESNNKMVDFKNTNKVYNPTQELCFNVSDVEGVIGINLYSIKLELNPKYQEIAKRIAKIKQDSKVMYLACRFNINDKSNLSQNTKLYNEYLTSLYPIEINF